MCGARRALLDVGGWGGVVVRELLVGHLVEAIFGGATSELSTPLASMVHFANIGYDEFGGGDLAEYTGEGRLERAGQVLELPLEGDATTATLTLVGLREFEFAIGGLGPVEEPKGAYHRLASLGFTTASPPQPRPGVQAASDPLAAAVMAFQRAHGLPPSGALDAATRDALHAAYGA